MPREGVSPAHSCGVYCRHLEVSPTYNGQEVTMMTLDRFDLQLFADGAAGGASGGAAADAGGETGVIPADAGQDGAAAATAQQDGAQPTTAKDDGSVDRQKAFEAMIKGEYKDLYDKRVQDTVRRRLRGQDALKAQVDGMAPVMQLLGQRYGVDAQDAAALARALEADDSLYAEEAMQRGITVEQLRDFKRLERENAAFRRQQEDAQRQARAQQQYAAWMQQAEETKAYYPQFDMDEECANDDFMRLLQSGVDVRTAYTVIHKDEIIPAAMQFAVQKTSQQLSAAVQANASRPVEGAVGGGAAATVRVDPAKMSQSDFEDIRKRVARGEKIVL